METKPKRIIFDATDEDREALEAIRKNRGHRSQAATLRELIRQAAGSGLPTPEQQAALRAEVTRQRRETVANSIADPPKRDAPIGDSLKVRLPIGRPAPKYGERAKKPKTGKR